MIGYIGGVMVKISVIMPVFNDEKNIKSSINSVLNQTLADIEIICIDDGSTDNSLNILKNFSKNDNRIRVFSQENQGSGKARNKGLSEVKGEYVAFLDSDDYIVDEKSFSRLYDEAKRYDMEMVSGGIQFVNNGNVRYEFRCFKPIKEINIKPVDDYGIPWYFYKNIFKREFLIENDIKFPDLLRGQDPIFLTKILSKLNYFLEVPVLYYSYNTPNENKINTSLKYHDFFAHFYEVFKIMLDKKKFNKMFLEYSEILINMPNRDIIINNEKELCSILKVMDNIQHLYIDYGNQNLLDKVCTSFNEIINKVNINNIDISISSNVHNQYSKNITISNKYF